MAHSFCAVTFFLNIVRIPAPKAPAWQVMKAHPLPLNQRDIRWPSVLLWDTQYLLSTKFVFTSFKATENNKVVYICVEFKLHQGQPGISINRKSEEFIRIIYLRFDKWNLKFSTAEQTPLCILHFLHLNLQRHNLPRSCWADKVISVRGFLPSWETLKALSYFHSCSSIRLMLESILLLNSA